MESQTLDMHMISNNSSVNVKFWDIEAKMYRLGLLTFDTGASVTTILKYALFDLGYNITDGKMQQITTASGVEYVREVTIMIGGYELENVFVYAHTFPEESFTTGVIGLNILSLFGINMLFSKRQIILEKFT